MLPSFWPLEILLSVLLGVFSHLLFFIHGELNRHALPILLFFLLLFALLLLLASTQEVSFARGFLLATLLFSSYQAGLGASIIVYRLYFHRARRFPGARGDAVSKWRAAGRASGSGGRYHLELVRLHARYGDFVRTGPMEISINNVAAVQALYGPQSPCTKGPWYDLGGVGQNLHRTRSRELHDRQRPFWEKAFTADALKHAMDQINAHVHLLLESLDPVPSHDPVNVTPLFEALGFELMAQFTFSQSFTPDEQATVRHALTLLQRSQSLLGTFGHVPWTYNVAARVPGLLRSNAAFTALANGMTKQRRRVRPETPDLFSWLFQTEGNPQAAGFPLEWEARLAIVAGSANISGLLVASTFYLSTHPTALKNLQAEVTPLLISNTFDMRKPLPVLDSILYESMRLQPLLPSGPERKTPPAGLRLADHTWIPGDVIARVPNWAICRDKRYFVHPNRFIPERWTTRKELVVDARVFAPFGGSGGYACVGRQLGMMQGRAVVANLAGRFDWVLSGETDAGEFEGQGGRECFVMVFGELWVRFQEAIHLCRGE